MLSNFVDVAGGIINASTFTGGAKVCALLTPESESKIQAMSKKYGLLAVSDERTTEFDYRLEYRDGGLCLVDTANLKLRPIAMQVKQVSRLSKRTALGSAIGRKSKFIIDATAGLGADTLLLARMGYCVHAVERVPAVAALLQDGITRAKNLSDSIQIVHSFEDARSAIQRLIDLSDVIYMDPMYPPRRKLSAAHARPLRVLRDLVGEDDDAMGLLQIALDSGCARVVVKRPHDCGPLGTRQPTFSESGKLVRYDVYLSPRRKRPC